MTKIYILLEPRCSNVWVSYKLTGDKWGKTQESLEPESKILLSGSLSYMEDRPFYSSREAPLQGNERERERERERGTANSIDRDHQPCQSGSTGGHRPYPLSQSGHFVCAERACVGPFGMADSTHPRHCPVYSS